MQVLMRRRVALRRHEAALAAQYRRQHARWVSELDDSDLAAAYDAAQKVNRRLQHPLAPEVVPEQPKEKWGAIGAQVGAWLSVFLPVDSFVEEDGRAGHEERSVVC
jgi:hypothetical protein